ncbi:hypothetical protein C7212DRAFT_163528 [Tuber magnatum]|uniref:Uncharacterized protein n=1 Tax=Tuber magnatum TaxID=42249 RepID=A0A317SZT3_9PEZI|nr:hypothetical protein C7212DRAFT_163528 [Tuber magnatum]
MSSNILATFLPATIAHSLQAPLNSASTSLFLNSPIYAIVTASAQGSDISSEDSDAVGFPTGVAARRACNMVDSNSRARCWRPLRAYNIESSVIAFSSNGVLSFEAGLGSRGNPFEVRFTSLESAGLTLAKKTASINAAWAPGRSFLNSQILETRNAAATLSSRHNDSSDSFSRGSCSIRW